MDTLSFLALDFDSIQTAVIKHFWYFGLILEHIVFFFHASPRYEVHDSAWACCVRNDLKRSGSRLLYDAHFQSVTIYKVVKRMIPRVLKSVQVLKVVLCIPALTQWRSDICVA